MDHIDKDDEASPFDSTGLLKDGRIARVKMTARDSRTVRSAIAAANLQVVGGGGSPNSPAARWRPPARARARAAGRGRCGG
jgi:hypothetical protein